MSADDKKEVINYGGDQEEEKQGNWEQKVDLPTEFKKTTGEEGEDCIYKQRAKLYRFRDEQWKERDDPHVGVERQQRNDDRRAVLDGRQDEEEGADREPLRGRPCRR